jgi:hypothetical protein
LSGGFGSYINWTSTPVDGEDMVNALVDVIKVYFQNTVHFDQATAYTQADATAPNIPRKTIPLTQVGTSAATTPSAAFSSTFNFKTLDNGIAKLVLLDSPQGSGWLAPVFPSDFSADDLSLEGAFTSDIWAWSGRDDARPAIMTKITFDVNDKLQKMYFG